jgi:serine acetyltransferase
MHIVCALLAYSSAYSTCTRALHLNVIRMHVQNVTLGGTGKDHGDRHPKISDNVLIGASATVLGNIRIGEGAQIAAGSLVLKPVAPHTMVAGSPAKPVGAVTGELMCGC